MVVHGYEQEERQQRLGVLGPGAATAGCSCPRGRKGKGLRRRNGALEPGGQLELGRGSGVQRRACRAGSDVGKQTELILRRGAARPNFGVRKCMEQVWGRSQGSGCSGMRATAGWRRAAEGGRATGGGRPAGRQWAERGTLNDVEWLGSVPTWRHTWCNLCLDFGWGHRPRLHVCGLRLFQTLHLVTSEAQRTRYILDTREREWPMQYAIQHNLVGLNGAMLIAPVFAQLGTVVGPRPRLAVKPTAAVEVRLCVALLKVFAPRQSQHVLAKVPVHVSTFSTLPE